MHVPHFFVNPSDVADGVAVVRGDEARHLVRVLRAGRGDSVTLADGTGAVYRAEVADTDDGVRLRLTARDWVPPPRPAVTVVHALPKGRKLDDVVQRLTELGVDRFVPVHSARSAVSLNAKKAAKARARWEAVALAAAKQSRRARLPGIDPVGEWPQAFANLPPGIVLWEQATEGLRGVVERTPPRDGITLAVGPEAGLAPEEIAACGCTPASLGPTILRTETAALVAVSAVLTLTGRLG